jgi:hypothetical protein
MERMRDSLPTLFLAHGQSQLGLASLAPFLQAQHARSWRADMANEA